MIYFKNHNLTDEFGYLAKTAQLGYLANNSFETVIMQLSTLGMVSNKLATQTIFGHKQFKQKLFQ